MISCGTVEMCRTWTGRGYAGYIFKTLTNILKAFVFFSQRSFVINVPWVLNTPLVISQEHATLILLYIFQQTNFTCRKKFLGYFS